MVFKCFLLVTFYCELIVVDGRDQLFPPPVFRSNGRGTSPTNATLLLPQAVRERKGGGDRSTATPSHDNAEPALKDMLRVRGACDVLSYLNTDCAEQGVTADNRSYYQCKDFSALYLYYDKDCAGDGKVAAGWIFDDDKPSITATSDLDGDKDCVFTGYIGSSSTIPPASAVWRLNCVAGFTDVPLTIKPVVDKYAGWHVCPPGSFCNGDACPSNNATAAIPRDRWDPEKCPTCSCSAWDPTLCAPPAMGPDSNGECSCPAQHRCEGGAVSSSSPGCVADNYFSKTSDLPKAPNDSCTFSNSGKCDVTQYCAAGTDCTDCGTCGPPARAQWHWNPHTCSTCICAPWCDTSASPYISCKKLELTSMAGVHMKNKQATSVDLSGNALIKLDDPLLFAGMTEMTTLALYDNSITDLAKELFSGLLALTTLSLDGNKLTVLQEQLFAGLLALTELDLYGTQISTIEDGAFSGLSALTKLSLAGNKLTVLQEQMFAGLSALANLYLHDNQISSIEDGAFSGLSALTKLRLDGNKLTLLEKQFLFTLPALTNLYLHNNQISSIEDRTFSELSALTVLQLSGNKLTILQEKVFAGLSALTELYLYNNQISSIDDSAYSKLSALTILNLSDNTLTGLRGKLLAGLSMLTELWLFDNQISTIEDATFSHLSALLILGLNRNKLTGLPGTCFAGLSAMTYLLLQGNQLSNLDDAIFADLSAIKLLDLENNKLTALQEKLFVGLPALTNLYLHDNQISSIEDRTFSELSALTVLQLSGNKLTILQEKVFAGLSAVTNLYLYDNLISSIENGTFSGLSALTILSLYGNRLTVVEEQLFAGLSALTYLGLNDNQISCIEDGTYSGLSTLTRLDLNSNKLTRLQATLFAGLTALTELRLHDNRLAGLNETIFFNLISLQYLDLSKNQLTAVDTQTFVPVASTLQSIYLTDNAISEVGFVLQEMWQRRYLKILAMEGNPSRCYVTSKTNQNLNGTIVCSCAEGFEHIVTSSSVDDSRNTGYLCQSPARAVIIPQTVATLRSQFLLVGPEEQLVATRPYIQPLKVEGAGFQWNGFNVDANDIAVKIHWLNKSIAKFNWTCSQIGNCTAGGNGDIVHPPRSTPDKSFGKDSPIRMGIKYNVNTTKATDISPTFATRATFIEMAYSAFHLPARFDAAFQSDAENGVTSQAVAGSGLPSPRLLWINQTITAQTPANITTKYDFLSTTANVSIEANPLIQTAIIFKLANNTCNTYHSANVLDVRAITSAANNDQKVTDANDGSSTSASSSTSTVIVGWEVVVGDPTEMTTKATNLTKGNTMKPCTAVLQAHDTVTTEILTITTIEASVQDCWDNGNPLNLNNTRHLSCNGHGSCNADTDLYDGYFEGCSCDTDWEGARCEVPLLCNRSEYEVYNSQTKQCDTFSLTMLKTRRKNKPLKSYIKPNVPVTPQAPPTYTVFASESFRIQPLQINTSATTVSSGAVDNITYTLNSNAPDEFFISSKTGEVFGEFDKGTPIDSDINVTLFAVDLSGLSRKVETMTFIVKPKPPDVVVPALLGCTGFAVVFGFAVHKLRERHLAIKDAIAALARAKKAYGIEDLKPDIRVGVGGGGMSINSGDLVGVTTTTTNAAFIGIDEESSSDSDDVVLLLDPAADESGIAIGYSNDLATYEDDDGKADDDHDDDSDSNSGAGGDYVLGLTPNTTTRQTKKKNANKRRRQKQLSKFVAPTMSLGKSTLAAKGLDVLLGIDPKTYMHVKNKLKVMLKEFAKNGTPEDIKNLQSLIDGTYKHPPNADGSPLTPDDICGQSKTIEELMQCSAVQDAGLEVHHVLALRVYTSSSYRSINDPMRQSPPVLPHPFAATLYYISDALSKLRELQGKDAAVRNETLVFWRGMKDLRITDEFIITGGSEMACMSTTSSREVAQEFALSKSPLLFKFVSNSFMSHGADISFLSVYPGEKEVLYPPLTYLRPIKVSKETIGTTVYTIVEVEPVFPK